MVKEKTNTLRIATLNLGGYKIKSIVENKKVPLHLQYIWNKNIETGLNGILQLSNKIDIIAIQEIPWKINEKGKIIANFQNSNIKYMIETIAERANYKLYMPSISDNRTKFTVGYLINRELLDVNAENAVIKESLTNEKGKYDCINRYMQLSASYNGITIRLLNLHCKLDDERFFDGTLDEGFSSFLDGGDKSINIILGDMNAHTNKQKEPGGENSNHPEYILNLQKRCDMNNTSTTDKNYTHLDGAWKKLDHIFIKPSNQELNLRIKEIVDNSVNWDIDPQGFTDHSMLVATIEFPQENS